MIRFGAKLRQQGILGINRRNLDYIAAHNPLEQRFLVNDKLRTKELLEQHNIPCPPLYACIKSIGEIEKLNNVQEAHGRFVIKPAQGSQGSGILLINKQRGDRHYQRINGKVITREEVENHIRNIVCGLFSRGARPDKAILEYLITPDPVFKEISYKGISDIRIVSLKGKPLMAMLRLPTVESQGKANLHLGGVGVGVDMDTGVTTYGIHHGKPVDWHPDTKQLLEGCAIPYWDEMQEISARLNDLTGLNYLGTDFILDKDHGPMVIEANVSPGLAIQLANQKGLVGLC